MVPTRLQPFFSSNELTGKIKTKKGPRRIKGRKKERCRCPRRHRPLPEKCSSLSLPLSQGSGRGKQKLVEYNGRKERKKEFIGPRRYHKTLHTLCTVFTHFTWGRGGRRRRVDSRREELKREERRTPTFSQTKNQSPLFPGFYYCYFYYCFVPHTCFWIIPDQPTGHVSYLHCSLSLASRASTVLLANLSPPRYGRTYDPHAVEVRSDKEERPKGLEIIFLQRLLSIYGTRRRVFKVVFQTACSAAPVKSRQREELEFK